MSEREFVQQLVPAEVEALIEIMYLAAEADGEVSPTELSELAETVERVTQGAVGKVVATKCLGQAQAALVSSSRAERLQVVKGALRQEQRAHALLLAVKVTAADGLIRTSERELILETADALEIDGATAANLVRAVER